MNNAKSALVDGSRAIAAGELEFSLAGLAGSDSSAVAVLLDWQRQAQQKNQRLVFLDIPVTLTSFAKLYGVDTLLTGFSGLVGTSTAASVSTATPHPPH